MNSSRYISFSFLSSFHSFFCGEFSLSPLIAQKCSFSWQWPPHTTSLSCPNPSISFTASRLHLPTHTHTRLCLVRSPSLGMAQGPSVCKSASPGRERKCRRACGTSLLATEFSCGTRKVEWKVAVLLYLRRCEKLGMWEITQNCLQKHCASTLSQQEVCLWKF